MKARVQKTVTKANKACQEYRNACETLRAKIQAELKIRLALAEMKAKLEAAEQKIQEQQATVQAKLDNAQEAIRVAQRTVEEESCISSEPSETKNRIFDDVIARCNADLTL